MIESKERDLSSTNYEKSVVSKDYKCDDCETHGVKLWREYQTFADNTSLRCAICAENQQKQSKDDPKWESSFRIGEGDQIGWLIPAIPVEGENTYWGYTSVPQEGCDWWNNLPTEVFSINQEVYFREPRGPHSEKLALYISAIGKRGPLTVLIVRKNDDSKSHPQILTLGDSSGLPIWVSYDGGLSEKFEVSGYWLTKEP